MVISTHIYFCTMLVNEPAEMCAYSLILKDESQHIPSYEMDTIRTGLLCEM